MAKSNDEQFSLGLFEAKKDYLTKGENRDKKLTISKKGKNRIVWFIQDEPLPKKQRKQKLNLHQMTLFGT